MRSTVAVLLLAAVGSSLAHDHKARAPALDVSSEGFRAMIKEDERRADVVPPIRVLAGTGPVCGYTLSSSSSSTNSSTHLFHVDLLERATGSALLRVADGARLDCKDGTEHALRLKAVGCDDEEAVESEEVPLTVYVADVNDHEPYFPQPWYTVEVEEGRVYTQLLSVRASDDDCGHPYGEICHYEIAAGAGGSSSPFEITDEGVLRNSAPLTSGSHALSVVAVDCGMRRSKPTLVTVNVRPKCDVKFKDVADRTDYHPSTGAKPLLPDVRLDLCRMDCVPEKATATVTLRTGHIGRGCDRDALDDLRNRKSCGLDPRTVDLLPRADGTGGKLTSNEVASSVADEAYMFNGADNAIVVPESTASPLFGDEFTLSFWMRHRKPVDEEDEGKKHHHKKENVVCSSDEHKMSRHHFAVYVRNCKLEMLHRTEPPEGQGNDGAVFRPAEWRWPLPEVCDDRWHHYTIAYNRTDAQLHVDGRAHAANAEVLDDVPLHARLDGRLRLVLGACWHARQQAMGQHFAGYLASVLYLPDGTQSEAAVQCLHRCNERLQFNGLDQLVPGEEAVFNAEMSSLTLSATNPNDVAKLLSKVAYSNGREQPTPGHRAVEVEASVKCANRPAPLRVQPLTTYVIVQKAPPPTIELTVDATKVIKRRSEVMQGALMFDGLKIRVMQPDADGLPHDSAPKRQLDWCTVHLLAGAKDGARRRIDADNEYFSSPAALVGQMRLDFEHDDYGLLLKGAERAGGYAEVLSQVRYFHMKPSALTARSYALECAAMGGAVRSRPLVVEMTVVADPPTEAPQVQDHQLGTEPAAGATDLRVDDNVMRGNERAYDFDRLKSVLEIDMPPPQPAYSLEDGSGQGRFAAGGAVAMVVIACVGLLLVLAVVGFVRARDARASGLRYRRAPNGEPGAPNDLTWDDTALNIRVNPLDDVEGELGAGAAAKLRECANLGAGANQQQLNAGFDMAGETTDADEEDEDVEGRHAPPQQSDTEYDTDDARLPHAQPCAKKAGGQSLEWEDDDQLCLPPPPAGRQPRC